MTDVTEKSYSPKKFRRKIPKVSRRYKRHQTEDKTFDKSEDELEMEKSIVDEIFAEVLEKGKKYPIGTVHNGYKKVAEGRWEKDTNGSKEGGKVQVSDKHKATMDKHVGGKKAKDAEYDRVGRIWERALNDDAFDVKELDGLSDELQSSLKQLHSTVQTLHGVKEDDEDYDAIAEAMEEANDAVQGPFNEHLASFKPDLNKDKKEKAKSKYEGDPAAEGEAAAKKDNEAAKEKASKKSPAEEGEDAARQDNIDFQSGDFSAWSDDKLERMLDFLDEQGVDDTSDEYMAIEAEFNRRGDSPAAEGARAGKEETKKSIIQENNMSDINKEMDAMADKMEKSADPKAVLKSTVIALGAEGLKKAMPDLSDEQKELLNEVLEEIKVEKAVSMDDVYDGDRKFITHDKMGTELEDGSDDEDEKLVKPEAKDINHQGDISPEGRDNHIIKSADEIIEDVLKGEFGSGMPAEDTMDKAYKACGACEQYDKACKACDDANGMKKSEESEENKSEETIMKSKEELIALKDEIVKSYEDAGLSYNEELIKSEMKKRLLKEEDQVKMGGQDKGGKKDKADKPSVPEIEVGKDANETADEAVSKVGKMKKSEGEEEPTEEIKKSIVYDSPNKRLAACTGGRNHHFSINNYYDEALRKSTAGEEGEDLKKSEGEEEKADDLNDIIEKGLDKDSDECKTEELFKSQNKGEYVAKSFADEDMVEAMNISKEDAEKILGK